jgi:hypothetical protein
MEEDRSTVHPTKTLSWWSSTSHAPPSRSSLDYSNELKVRLQKKRCEKRILLEKSKPNDVLKRIGCLERRIKES